MGPELDRVLLTRAARAILEAADSCAGLRPHVGSDGPCGYGRTAVAVESGTRNALFAIIVIDRSGRILRAFLLHGNWGEQHRYEGAQAVSTRC